MSRSLTGSARAFFAKNKQREAFASETAGMTETTSAELNALYDAMRDERPGLLSSAGYFCLACVDAAGRDARPWPIDPGTACAGCGREIVR